MSLSASSPPLHPDMKRELKQQLLALSARGFEFFAGEFLVYVGLEAVAVTRYIGDGGIDALGDLRAGRFRIPIGIQVKRHRNNVQRPDIDRFVGALSERFSQGLFLTTANYAPAALKKAAASIPRVLTLNGDQVVSIMVEHQLGVKRSSFHARKLDIDPDYFATFEAMRSLFAGRVKERSHHYSTAHSSDEDTLEESAVDLLPEEDLLSLNAFGYALRVDPTRVRRWVENGVLLPDASQSSGESLSSILCK
ncbi:MAG TPA: restriction endonuclease [Ktedonobacteraceae bacterium]|nr:restriction endonuclease [Ktedonobacteraceae bacterium]